MLKNLLLLIMLSVSFSGFSQVKEDGNKPKRLIDYITNSLKTKENGQYKEVQQYKDTYKVDFSSKEFRKYKKEFSGKLTFETADGGSHPITTEEFLVRFKDGVSVSEMINITSSLDGVKGIKEDKIFTPRNIAFVTLDQVGDFKSLFDAIRTLNNHPKVDYAHLMYKGSGDTNFGTTGITMVKLRSASDYNFLVQQAGRFGARVMEEKGIPNKNVYFLEASNSSNFDVDKLTQSLAKTKRFEYVESDVLMTNLRSNTNDPLVGDQWGLNNDAVNTAPWGGTADVDINAFEAWALADGAGIRIAIIDEGVDLDHPDLDVLPGFDATGGGSAGDATGNDAHGTACGGIAAGIGDNNIGVSGVANAASVVPIRFLVGGSGSTADAITAVFWANNEGMADVTSNSWGGGGFSQALLDAIIDGGENGRGGLGTLFIAASGNGNSGVDFPAAYDNEYVVAVGAMTMCAERKNPASCDDEDFWGSNFGDELDVMGPSPKIVTSDIAGNAGYSSGDYTTTFNGTSAATPFVAGVVGLMLGNNPTLSAAETRTILEQSCRKLGTFDYQEGVPGHPNGSWDDEAGYGLVNAFEAVVLTNTGPEVIIDPTSTNRTLIEAEGCELFAEYEFAVTILGEYTGTDNPEVTVSFAGTALSPDDYEIVGSNVLTFTTGMAETQSFTVRTLSDGIDDANETIEFTISLDAGDTNTQLGPADFTTTTWTLLDATEPEERAEVGFTEEIDGAVVPGGSLNQITLDLDLDNFPGETTWEIVDDVLGGVVASGGPYTTSDDPVSEVLTLPDGNYTFTIFDSFGDGICCAFGVGSYTLTDSDGNVLASGGDFGGSESTSFTLGDVEPPSCFANDVTLDINLDNFPSETTWEIVENTSSSVVASGGPYTTGDNPVSVTVNLPDSEYTFTIFDQFSDGICCGFGAGSYTLTDSNGNVIVTGGEFGASESTTFCTSVDAGSQPVGTVNGALPIDGTIDEVVNCGDDFADYFIGVTTTACVTGEQDYTATINVDPSSTATEGEDFEFLSGNIVPFSGEDAETFILPIRFFGDGIAEGTETLILNITLSDDLADLGVSTTTITIIDVDLPVLTLSSISEIREADYNCDSTSNTFEITVNVDTCPDAVLNATMEISQDDSSVALVGDDFNFVGDTTYTLTNDNMMDPIVFTVEVFDDGILEGSEAMIFNLTFAEDLTASASNIPYEVTLMDPQGVTAPTTEAVGMIDFEGGLPAGWTFVEALEDGPNEFVVSGNTAMNGLAAHVTNDAEGSQIHEYDNQGGSDVYLISPLLSITESTPWDYLFQVEGEVGFFAFDFGFGGLIDGAVDINDTDAVIGSLFGNFLFGEPDPILLSEYLGATPDLFGIYEAGGFDGPVRIAYLFRSDGSITGQPPLGVDDIDLTNVESGNFIEANKMIGSEIPEYPLNSGIDTYYYNVEDLDIAMRMNSSSDHDCSSGYVAQSGTGTQQLISEFPDEFTSEKIFAFEAGTADRDATLDVGLYYTEAEITGWEAATGKSRDELYMFKAYDFIPVTCFGGDVQLTLLTDDFPGETTWELVDDSTGSIVASGGPYTTAGETINESFSLATGDYTFTIFDAFGDGICCGFGDGAYSLTSGGDTIVEGGAFGDSESTSFCVSDEVLELCQDYTDIDFAPVTLVPYANGYQAIASFDTGLSELTSFGISAIPSFTPGEFTAVQNEEQIDITFENKYSQDNISYFLFEEFTSDLEWVEFEIVTPNTTGIYELIDYFPYNGLNRYRVAAILNSGEIIYACLEAEAFFDPTNDFQISPNPAANNINIILSDGKVDGFVNLEIYDERGRIVMEQDLVSTTGVVRYDVDISELALGQYYVRIVAEDGFDRTTTFIKAAN